MLFRSKKPNICHVISGKLKSTGGYEFKYEIVPNDFVYTTTWDDICRDKGYENKSKGPSSKRILHRQIEGVECKKCGKCQKWLDIKHFVYCKQSWDKLRNTCNPCLSEERKKNKDRMTKYNKQYWIHTKEQQTERHKEWKKANREHINKYSREYKRVWEKKQRETNPSFKILKNLRCRLYKAVTSQNVTKCGSTLDLIGCSIDFLKGYLAGKFEQGMTWENYGEWHIDHRIPCASFDFTQESEQKKCFHYTNLQPMWGSENISKGATVPEYTWDDVIDELIFL